MILSIITLDYVIYLHEIQILVKFWLYNYFMLMNGSNIVELLDNLSQ